MPRKGQKGRKTLLLDGYNPTTGTWKDDSPAGKVIAAVRAGNYLVHAAAYAGISERAVHNWRARGQQAIDTLAAAHPDTDIDDFDIDRFPTTERMYVQFARAATHARGGSVVELVTLMRHHARDDWRAADRLLQLIDPDHFQPRSRTEHSGPAGGPIEVTGVGVLDALAPLISPEPDSGK